MYDYALIIHPTNEELLHKYEPGMKHKSRPLVRKLLEWMSPFKAAEVEGLNSPLGRTAKGAMVMCPLLMEQMVSLSPTKVMKAVIDTMRFARSLEPKIIGITAYAAFSGNKGLDLAKMIDTEAALVFGSGFLTNLGVMTSLAGPGDWIFSDRLNHASLIDGIRLSRAHCDRYRHKDIHRPGNYQLRCKLDQ